MITTPVLIDTGPLVSILRADDQHHLACVKQLKEIRTPAVTCWPVLTEAAYLLRANHGQVAALLSKCDGSRFDILPLNASDLPGITAILAKYRDQAFDLADAALMHLAQRDRIEHVFTLDRTDFSIYRTAAGRTLTILPS